ncbi:MAG TPA: hypothetical protein VMF13_14145 [Luteitalea sp.]|nr:hypothetical protein [Luteitalea sp.]
MAHVSLDQARAAKKQTQARLEAQGRSAAVGITRVDGEYAVKVNFPTPHEAAAAIPREVDGVTVQVEVVGAIRKRRAR